MLFNSVTFLIFFVVVFALYWSCAEHLRLSNAFLLLASYVFYGWWDWRFLSLLVFSSVVDYVVALALKHQTCTGVRKGLLLGSVVVNLGLLGFFKYYNFFIGSFAEFVEKCGLAAHLPTLHVILPVGISFYTFQTMSYTIDVYRRKMEPTADPIAFLAYVSFFPQLVAGPIERAIALLPQFSVVRTFDVALARDGLRQILWGYVKKVVVADNLAGSVDAVFGNYQGLSGWSQILGVVFFAFQIYCDFSGYSDIAVGTAKLFGFRLMRNFATPYFARSVGEFWRRWHISLSTWFRDYVYIPLGGNRVNEGRRALNLGVTFILSGLWHGANWTFVIWGGLHGLFCMIGQWMRPRDGEAVDVRSRDWSDVFRMARTFGLVCLGWVFFRADSLTHAIGFLRHTVTHLDSMPDLMALPFTLCLTLVVVEWLQRRREHPLQIDHVPVMGRWCLYYACALSVIVLGEPRAKAFIYFQF